jgi:hypothetical protein
MVQIKIFPNFYWILKPKHMTFTQLYTWNYTQLLWWRIAFITDRPSLAYSLQMNESMYVKRTNKACEKAQYIQQSTKLPTTIYYIQSFSFYLPPLEPKTWHMFYFLLICSKLFYTPFASPNSFMLVYNLVVSFTEVCTYLLK